MSLISAQHRWFERCIIPIWFGNSEILRYICIRSRLGHRAKLSLNPLSVRCLPKRAQCELKPLAVSIGNHQDGPFQDAISHRGAGFDPAPFYTTRARWLPTVEVLD
uniref:Uncharacterized protein n=1 Tax=Spongospora subterranea TaxID=70186 RepID=A0A0H5QIK3_9EUKA|eukprot:CRZ01905.1 hypothetical protein [Spongospora subterranea]